jgi:hypothetical protein
MWRLRNIITIFGAILFASFILTSCGDTSKDKKEETKTAEIIETSMDTIKDSDNGNTVPEKTVQANVSCNLFFEGMDFTDEETGETEEGEVGERKEFKTKKSYTFCYDSEVFHHLTLKGTGENLSFFVKVGNKLVYKKEGFDLVDKFTFTSKDFNFGMDESYSIVIKQNETTIFNGKIDSQGCM